MIPIYEILEYIAIGEPRETKDQNSLLLWEYLEVEVAYQVKKSPVNYVHYASEELCLVDPSDTAVIQKAARRIMDKSKAQAEEANSLGLERPFELVYGLVEVWGKNRLMVGSEYLS